MDTNYSLFTMALINLKGSKTGTYIKDTGTNKEERLLVDVVMEEPTTTECSVNCGKGNTTTYSVICKGAERKVQRSGKATINYRINDTLGCHIKKTKQECEVYEGGGCDGMLIDNV